MPPLRWLKWYDDRYKRYTDCQALQLNPARSIRYPMCSKRVIGKALT